MKYLSIALLWAAYCGLHSYLISIGFTKLMERLLKSYYAFYRLAYVAVSIVLFVPLLKLTVRLNDPAIITYGYTLSMVLRLLSAGSLLMFFWAFFFDYDSLSFFGFRQISKFGKAGKPGGPGKLKKSGLLGVTRHPMYFALIVYLWCHTFRVCDIVVNAVFTIYIVIGTVLEENKLVLEFGDAYAEYKREVPMLIPFVKIRVNRFPIFSGKAAITEAGVKYIAK